MFKDIQRVFGKSFTTEKMIILIVFLFLGYVLYSYSSSKDHVIDRMTTGYGHSPYSQPSSLPSMSVMPSMSPPPMSQPSNSILDLAPSSSHTGGPEHGSDYSLQTVANPNDLLPKDMNSQWSNLNSLNSNNITTPDLLQAGYHIGLDTIGQTLRNANLQERSDPIIPKQDVGPWHASTIEPDYGRTPLEVGFGPR